MPRRPANANQSDVSRVFVDSGGFIGLFSAADRHHAEADELFRRCSGKRVKLVTSQLVLAEVHRALLFRTGNAFAADALAKIDASSMTVVEYTTSKHHRAALEWLRELDDQEISYADAVSFAIMSATDCGVVLGFDHDFVVAGFEQLRVDML